MACFIVVVDGGGIIVANIGISSSAYRVETALTRADSSKAMNMARISSGSNSAATNISLISASASASMDAVSAELLVPFAPIMANSNILVFLADKLSTTAIAVAKKPFIKPIDLIALWVAEMSDKKVFLKTEFIDESFAAVELLPEEMRAIFIALDESALVRAVSTL